MSFDPYHYSLLEPSAWKPWAAHVQQGMSSGGFRRYAASRVAAAALVIVLLIAIMLVYARLLESFAGNWDAPSYIQGLF